MISFDDIVVLSVWLAVFVAVFVVDHFIKRKFRR
jgi:purine-cytosine permease-like protein